jgi:hypothetical protein
MKSFINICVLVLSFIVISCGKDQNTNNQLSSLNNNDIMAANDVVGSDGTIYGTNSNTNPVAAYEDPIANPCHRRNCKQVTYLIKEGKHSASGVNIGGFWRKNMEFSAKFTESAIYDIGPVEQSDINKLKGFSDCTSAHHKNSARFGWRWYQGELQILAYTYADRVRSYKLITSIDTYKMYKYSIFVEGDRYRFVVNSQTVYMPRGCSSKRAKGYKLYPYFGGNIVAPHDVTIDIWQ